jgi:hypothetical protein
VRLGWRRLAGLCKRLLQRGEIGAHVGQPLFQDGDARCRIRVGPGRR